VYDAPIEQTTYGFSDLVPAPPERRLNLRHATTKLAAILETEEGPELCLVRDVSRGGLRACVYRDVPVGSRVAVTLKSGFEVSGVVVWAEAEHIGVKFWRPADIWDALDRATTAANGQTDRLPRIAIRRPVAIRAEARIRRGETVDLSQSGVKVELTQPLLPGQVTVSLAGLPKMDGTVRWFDGPYAGISFSKLIPLRRLVRWASSGAEDSPLGDDSDTPPLRCTRPR
jgi:hypothetical protein